MRELVYVERDGPIATVVLNRAEKLNALTRGMYVASETVEQLSAGGHAALCVSSVGPAKIIFARKRHR